MRRQKHHAVPLLILSLCLVGAALPASAATPAEQTELAAAASPAAPQPAVPTGVPIVCPQGTVPSTFYLADFETDDGGWVESGFGEWERGPVVTGVYQLCDTTPRPEPTGAPSGVNVFATNLDGCYANSGQASLLSRTFDFSSLAAPIQLDWTNWYEVFTPFDIGEVLVNGTQVFNIVPSTATSNYQDESADLSAYAGNAAVTVDFRLFATTVVNRMGWYIDDVEVLTCVPDQVDADLELTKQAAPATAAPGDPVVFTITVTNLGPGDATDVVVTDTLPAGLVYVSNDCGANWALPTLTWNIGQLTNGTTLVCNVTTTLAPDATGALTNAATATATSNDPNGANNAAAAAVVVQQSVLAIPTLGVSGLALLALLLAGIAFALLRRRAA
ncbi:MAG TPA: DUF11 domain-containing protein [Thermoanaerobaculia bacterium]|nr:DUF11 domain-containing protein [Thermoanaerobaculia bacterium]